MTDSITKSTQTKRLSNLERRLTDTEHSIKHIFQTIVKLQARFDTFETFLYENIELIKCMKADKEDVIERFETKADCEKKVEFHIFEHTRKDFAVGLTIALEKIENMFRQLCDVKDKINEFELSGLGCKNQDRRVCLDARCKLLAKFDSVKRLKNNFDEAYVNKISEKKLGEDLVRSASRFCGGSGRHTKTNAMERIFKQYNFYNDHPDVEPCASCLDEHAFMVGSDGILYRVQKMKCDCNESTENVHRGKG